MTAALLKSAHRALWRSSRVVTIPTQRFRDLPDFLIIGAQRSGTTSLYRYLEHHPAVVPAVLCKGVHYFDVSYPRGDAWYRSHFPTRAYRRAVSERAGQRAITGEGSPYYLFHPAVPARAAATIPDARVIAILRNPVSRAYSQYQHEVARGFETLSFLDALRAEDERLAGEAERLRDDPGYHSFSHQHHSYVARGVYVDQIRRWRSSFPSSQILIVDGGEFFREPDRTYRDVVSFLGLSDHMLKLYSPLNAHAYEPMSAGARAFLDEAFSEPNRALSAYLGRTFSW
jgi:hypothetical protein